MMTTQRAVAARLTAATLILSLLSAPAAPIAAQELIRPSGTPIAVTVSKGVLISLDHPADTVFVADPNIADVQVKSPKLIYLYGKEPGDTSLYAVDADQKVLLSRPISVSRNVATLQSALSRLQPGGGVHVSSVDKSLVLSGNVSSASAAEEVKHLASAFVSDDKQLVDRMTVDRPYQVNLRVRIAEVSRSVTKELGFNWDAISRPGSFVLGLATGNPVLAAQGAPALTPIVPTDPASASLFNRNPGFGGTKTDSFSFGFNNNRNLIDSVIDALDQNGLVTILAEPNLTAMSGETASFLAGGEFPIIIPGGQLGQTTVEFKQYGVSLAFTPVVLDGGRISMRVRPEVSELSTTGSVEISGTSIPGITTRRAETSIELNSGQSFAIGGLLENDNTNTINKVPGLGDLPVLGPLFRSTQFQHNESELVIIVTPYLVRPSSVRLATPVDGYAPPSDKDIYVNGHTTRQAPAYGGAVPPAVAAGGASPAHAAPPAGLVGPAGFVLN
jgi:pilus assembly protein CpaC